MARRLIGTAVTDANGEATITYTGTGAGQLNVVAESGTFQSETFVVTDGIFYDKGILNDPSTRDWSGSSNMDITRQATGTLLDNHDNTNLGYAYLTCSTIDNICFEIDIKVNNLTNFVIMSLRQNTTNRAGYYTNWLGLQDNTWHHVKFTVSNGQIIANVDGADKTPQTITDTWNRFFLISDKTATVTTEYKNFIVYPI